MGALLACFCDSPAVAAPEAAVDVPVPEQAEALGLGAEHPMLLREYFEKHGLAAPDWMASDEEVWDHFIKELTARIEKQKTLDDYSNLVQLEHHGVPAAILRAAPGERLQVRITGFIHNLNGDTCIHQLILVMDTSIVAELYEGVPRRGEEISKEVSIEAPQEVGVYMFWRYPALKNFMQDAREAFENGDRSYGGIWSREHPAAFVGWLIVE